MANTVVNISLKSKDSTSVNITTLSGGEIISGANVLPLIKFIPTGAQGPIGSTGAAGTASIGTGEVTHIHLATDSVGSDKIINGSVGYNEIENSAVRGSKIQSEAITTDKILDGAVTQNKLANNSVGVAQIIDGTVTRELLADGIINGGKIEDNSILTSKIGNNQILTSKLADRNVTGDKISSNPDLDGEVKANNLKLKGSSPATLTGPDSHALQIKSNTTIDFQNTSNTTIASLDQSGNLTISGTVDGRDIAADGVKIDGISDNEIIDWSVAQTESIHASNYTDTNTQLPLINDNSMSTATNNNVASASSIKSYVDSQTHLELGTTSATALAGNTITISTAQANAITANTAKVSFPGLGTSSTTALAGDTSLLQLGTSGTTALAGDTTTISGTQASAITANTAKTGITTSQANAITANTAKPDLTIDGAGTVHANNYTDTQYSVMGSGNGYAAGLVKAGGILHSNAFLRKDGSWAVPTDTNTTYIEATSSAEGLMSTAHHDKLDGIAAGATAYADADAVSAVATADDYLRNDANEVLAGSLEINDQLFIVKDTGGSKVRFKNTTTTTNRTLTVPDANGILALTNSLIDTKTAAYWSSSTGGFYITLSGASTSENTSLSTASYTLMYVAPFDGKIKRISSFHQNAASGTSTFEIYIDGDDSDLTNDQRGSDMTTSSFTRKFTEDCPTDWTFSKGEAIAIKRTDSVARYGVTMTIVFEYDTTT